MDGRNRFASLARPGLGMASASQAGIDLKLDRFAGTSQRRFSEALQCAPPGKQIHISIGEHPVDLCLGDESLGPVFCAALNCTDIQGRGLAPFRIVLHTFASAGISHSVSSGAADNEVLVLHDAELTYISQRNGEFVCCVDWKRNTGYCVVPDASRVPFIDSAAPLRHLLSLWFGRQGKALTHAAAVGVGSEGVLIVGHGGSGKSTTSVLCMADGLEFVSDDHCLVGLEDGPAVYSLYSSVKIAAADVDGLPVLGAIPQLGGRPPAEKMVFLLNGCSAVRLSRKLRIRGLFLAQIVARNESSLRPAGRAQAFKTLSASTALHLPGERRNALSIFAELSRRVPAYLLELGSDRRQIPELIRNYLWEAD